MKLLLVSICVKTNSVFDKGPPIICDLVLGRIYGGMNGSGRPLPKRSKVDNKLLILSCFINFSAV